MNGPASDRLPPHDSTAEAAALGCVLLAGIQSSQAEVDCLLGQLRPQFFFELRHQKLLAVLCEMRGGESAHAVDLVTVASVLSGRGELEAVGGAGYLASLLESVPGVGNFGSYLSILKDRALRRWCLAKSVRLSDRAYGAELSAAELQGEFAEVLEQSFRLGPARPLIETWTIGDAQSYKPDPRRWLVGAGLIVLGETFVIAGPAGVGKSRMGNTLAFAGARGAGEWFGYSVRRRWRTLVLQSENSPERIQSEVAEVAADEVGDWVRFSLPCFMQFSNPAFRSELRRLWESWPFDLLLVDNMNDVARADGREDYLEGLANIQASLPPYPDTPSIGIIAHLRKARGGENWRPRSGRQLLDELTGSFALGAKARTVLFLQPGSASLEDDRVILDCGKCNNDQPLPISAWHRRNVAFVPCPDFNWDEWHNPPEDGRRIVTESDLCEVFQSGRRRLARKAAVSALVEAGFATATAYRAFAADGKFAAKVREVDGLLEWVG